MAPRLPFLRPYAFHAVAAGTPARCSAYLDFYELAWAQKSRSPRCAKQNYVASKLEEELSPAQASAMRTRRIQELDAAGGLEYPRFNFNGKPVSTRQFRTEFEKRSKEELHSPQRYCIHGRILSIRRHGPKFSFVRIIHDGVPLQIMVNAMKLKPKVGEQELKDIHKLLQRGDHISVSGQPALSESGQLCIEARELPKLCSPCLVPLPFKLSPESTVQNRHMDMLINRSSREMLLMRDFILRHMRAHLSKVLNCVEVQTPILAANAGGALARPFATQASEFPHKELALRIAPELWLKRLVVAGLDRVFEIGPSFRNEGVDATHNPEFTTCEFYLAHTNLGALINVTQNLLYGLARSIDTNREKKFPTLEVPDMSVFREQFHVIEFIPAIEAALGQPLPDLESPTALPDLTKLLDEAGKDWHHALPSNRSLSKLLDHIASIIIEPQSHGRPLFILHHPVCMSPLSKSFTCPETGQHVAARAELFYNGNELANMYEEENDPFKQRAKFVSQAKAHLALLRGGEVADDDIPPHVIDEQYLSVLESGLPPTGGWGCGVDRLVMLFAGAKRISDVQPFGNLRHVVGLASVGAPRHREQDGDDFESRANLARDTVRDICKAAVSTKEAGNKRRGKKAARHAIWTADEDDSATKTDDGVDEILYRNKGSMVIGNDGSEKKE